MIKVIVVIYGLVLLVPGGGEGDMLTAVFLETGHLDPSMEHDPAVRQIEPMTGSGNSWPLDDYFVLELGPSETSGSLDALDRFAQLSDLSDDSGFGVRSECASGSKDCRNNAGEHLVRGVLRVKAPWKVREASYCGEWVLPICFRDDGEYQYRRTELGTPRHTEPFSLATALVLEGEVASSDLSDLVMLEGSATGREPVPLVKTKAEACQEWFGDEDVSNCVILTAGNPAVHRERDRRRLDLHFAAFYELTSPKPPSNARWLPYLDVGGYRCDLDVDCGRDLAPLDGWHRVPAFFEAGEPDNDPSPRCPPPVGYPVTEAEAER